MIPSRPVDRRICVSICDLSMREHRHVIFSGVSTIVSAMLT